MTKYPDKVKPMKSDTNMQFSHSQKICIIINTDTTNLDELLFRENICKCINYVQNGNMKQQKLFSKNLLNYSPAEEFGATTGECK